MRERQLLHSGEQVKWRGIRGIITEVFPDGLHMVRLAATGEIVAALPWQLKLIEPVKVRKRNAPAAIAKHSQRTMPRRRSAA